MFVGRERELGLLSEELLAASAGTPSVVFVEGEAGMGKTALVDTALSLLSHVPVWRASSSKVERRLEFGIVQQLAPGLARLDEGEVDPLEVGAELLSRLGDTLGDLPLVIWVDDVQWADVSSTTALAFVLRRLRAERVLVILCARSEDTLDDNLARAATGHRVRRLDLRGLGSTEVAELYGGLAGIELPVAAGQRLLRHTGGSPLHVRALVGELTPDMLVSGSQLPAPRTFASVVALRLARCPEPVRRVIESGSVLGERFAVAEAAEVAGSSATEPWPDDAVAVGLIDAAPDAPGQVAFRHPLVRAAVYGNLSSSRRRELHERAAAVLDGDDGLLHRAAAATRGDAQVIADLEEAAAAREAEGALAVAGDRLLVASRLAEGPKRNALFLAAMERLLAAGESAEAAGFRDDVARLPMTPGRDAVLGELAHVAGRPREAEQLLAAALGAMEPSSAGAARVAARLAQLSVIRSRGLAAVEYGQRALSVPDPSPEVVGLASSSVLLGMAITGGASDALSLAESAVAGTGAGSGHGLAARVSRGILRLWTDDTAGAYEDLRSVVHHPHRLASYALPAFAYLAEVDYRAGRWDDARVHGALAASLMDDAGARWLKALAHSIAVLVPAATGDWSRAEVHADAASRAASDLGDEASIGYAADAGATLAAARGEWLAVIAAVEPLFELEATDGLFEPGILRWPLLHAEALVRLGRYDRAEDHLGRHERLAEARGLGSECARAARVRGLLHAARGDRRAARSAFDAGLAHSARTLGPYERGLIELSVGVFLLDERDHAVAAGLLTTALRRFELLGAAPAAADCVRHLRSVGVRPRLGGRDDVASALTAHERAVATLVATGRTNREVASELVVSVKTVEYHLTNTYLKLGVRNRTELAARMSLTDPGED